jgi:hypothetical protein
LETEKRLKLRPRKKKALIDLIVSAPTLYSKSMSQAGIIHGGIKNGMLDKKAKKFPCFDGMFSTLGRNPTALEYDMIEKALPLLLKIQDEKGFIDESVYDSLNFALDTRPNGEDYLRNATIAQEHLQRAKTLSHPNQVEERKRLKNE